MNMRFIILAKIPTEDGNKMVQDPNLLEKLEKYINKSRLKQHISLKRMAIEWFPLLLT